ncbi:hypothetical protein K438DRAFT_1784953 [Mycena galopus ATCC 62051]|nr:hypothetical protein K438DRAFT_1784953 [Mycena galopus ATCC 62051]
MGPKTGNKGGGGVKQPDKKRGNKEGSEVGFKLNTTTLYLFALVRARCEKEGSKNARHNNVDFSTNICAQSYINVQVFDIWSRNLFRGTHKRLPMAFKFTKIQPRFFLYFDMPWGQKWELSQPERYYTLDNTHVVITDTLVQGLIYKSGTTPLVPRLFSLNLTSLLGFTDSMYADLVTLRVKLNDELDPNHVFQTELWWAIGCRREVSSEMLDTLLELVLEGGLHFVSGQA